jgi:hypothetical protein
MRAADWSNRKHGNQRSAANSAISTCIYIASRGFCLHHTLGSFSLITSPKSCIWSRMKSILQTGFKVSDIEVSDAQDIGRHIEVPAMHNGPLYRTMFPQLNIATEAQKEQIIRWYIEMLEDAFQAQEKKFLKVCSTDGTPVGFCGWIEQNYNQQQANEPKQREKARKRSWLPDTLDVDRWVALSNNLRAERYRVLKDLDIICRK